MKNTKMLLVAGAIVAVASAASAGGNSENAKAMAANLQTYGGNLATAVKANGPFDQGPGQRGWGNAGSLLTGNGTVDGLDGTVDGDFAAGGQVSKSGKRN